jgi:TPR repeat protein
MRLIAKLGMALFSLLFVFSLCQADPFVDEIRSRADKGDSTAQYNLGLMYAKGQEVPRDYDEAVKWFKKAADQEDANCQYILLVMYKRGRAVAQRR